MQLLGAIFSGGLIHKYLQQWDAVRGADYTVMYCRNMSASATVWNIYVVSLVF